MTLADLVIVVRAQTAQAEAAIAKTAAQVKAMETTTATAGTGWTSMWSTVKKGAIIAVAALGVFSIAAAKSLHTYEDQGKQIKEVQRAMGGSAEAASTLVGQIQLIGGENINASTAMARFSANLGAAQQGTGSALAVLNKYGIALRDTNGQVRSGIDVFNDFRNKMSELTNVNERNYALQQVMGRGYRQILPLFTKSASEIDKMNAKLKGMGAVWSDKQLKDWQDMAMQQKEMTFYLTQIQVQLARIVEPIVKVILPKVEWLLGLLSKMPQPIKEAGAYGIILAGSLGGVILVSAKILEAWKTFKEIQIVSLALTKGQAIWSAIAGVATGAWAIAQGALATATAAVAAALDSCGLGEILLVIGLIALAVVGVVEAIIHWRGTLHTISAAVDVFRDHWKLFAAVVLGPVVGAIFLLVAYWGKVRDAAGACWDFIAGKITWIGSIITAPFDALLKIVQAVIDKVKELAALPGKFAGGLWDKLGGWSGVATGVALGPAGWAVGKATGAFAEGGVVTRPTIGLMGEKGEPEYVVPQSKVGQFVAKVGGGQTINLGGIHIAAIHGTDRASARKAADMVMEEVGMRLAQLGVA